MSDPGRDPGRDHDRDPGRDHDRDPGGAPQPTLSDGVVTLRPFRAGDAQAVFEACQDPAIARFIPIPQPYTLEDGAWYVAHAARESAAGPSAHFACVDAATDRLLGSISRHGPAAEAAHRAAVGYWLAPDGRGRGVATRAVRLLVDWTFATTDVARVELYTDVANHRSGRVALRAGFELEGVRRSWDVDRAGRPIDSVFYVRLRNP